MFYVCVEEKQISAVLNYKPSVPSSVKVFEISDEEYTAVESGDKSFNPISGKVEATPANILNAKLAEQEKLMKLEFLAQTDWKILRHLREQALAIPTTLTEQEYINLENERQRVSKSI